MAEIDITVSIRGNDKVEAALKIAKKKISSRAALRKMGRPAAKVIAEGIKAAQFVLEKGEPVYHYSYRGGKRVSQFTPGHLRRSIREVSTIKSLYKKFPELYVGPVFTGNASKGGSFTGFGKDVDAYYAHMMLGSARAYESQVVQKGFNSVKNIAGSLVIKEAERIINKEAKRAGLR